MDKMPPVFEEKEKPMDLRRLSTTSTKSPCSIENESPPSSPIDSSPFSQRERGTPERYTKRSTPESYEETKDYCDSDEMTSSASPAPLNLSCESGSVGDEDDYEDCNNQPQDLSLRKSENRDPIRPYPNGLLMFAPPLRRDYHHHEVNSKKRTIPNNDNVSYKRVRLEETVNHIRNKCSSESTVRVPTNGQTTELLPQRKQNGRSRKQMILKRSGSNDSIHKDNETEWTPEKIFVFPNGEKNEEEDAKKPEYQFPLNPLQMPYLLNGAASSLSGMEGEREVLLQRLMQLSSMQLLGVNIPPEYEVLMRQMSPGFMSWPHAYANYYAQMMQSLQNQQLMRHHHNQQQHQQHHQHQNGKSSPEEEVTSGNSSSALQDDVALNNRKRAPRALTGKHVKHGTGASPSTLMTLRKKIEQRQRIREVLGEMPASHTSHSRRK